MRLNPGNDEEEFVLGERKSVSQACERLENPERRRQKPPNSGVKRQHVDHAARQLIFHFRPRESGWSRHAGNEEVVKIPTLYSIKS